VVVCYASFNCNEHSLLLRSSARHRATSDYGELFTVELKTFARSFALFATFTASTSATANIANAVVGQNDIDAARFITLPFDEVFDNTGLTPSSAKDASGEVWPEDICESGGAGYMHYKYKPTEDQMINIVASGDDTEIRVINSENDTCLHFQDNDNLNYFAGGGNGESGIFVPDTDEGGNYIPASVDDPDYGYVGEAPHWYQETYFSDYGTCGHGCSEDTVDEVSLTANTTYIIQIAANSSGRVIQGGPCDDEELPDGSCLYDNRSPTFVSIAVGGVGAARDRPSPASTAVPTLPLFGVGILVSLLGLFGLRKLRQ
jgi:hypothetical protein